MFNIWIDADGCPVIEETLVIGERFHIDVKIVCDTSHELFYEGIETIVVDQGKDHADFAILHAIHKHDIVVTQDYGLASLALSKQAYVISNDGELYTADTINQMLYQRMLHMKARRHGVYPKNKRKRTEMQDHKYVNALTSLVMNILEME